MFIGVIILLFILVKNKNKTKKWEMKHKKYMRRKRWEDMRTSLRYKWKESSDFPSLALSLSLVLARCSQFNKKCEMLQMIAAASRT